MVVFRCSEGPVHSILSHINEPRPFPLRSSKPPPVTFFGIIRFPLVPIPSKTPPFEDLEKSCISTSIISISIIIPHLRNLPGMLCLLPAGSRTMFPLLPSSFPILFPPNLLPLQRQPLKLPRLKITPNALRHLTIYLILSLRMSLPEKVARS